MTRYLTHAALTLLFVLYLGGPIKSLSALMPPSALTSLGSDEMATHCPSADQFCGNQALPDIEDALLLPQGDTKREVLRALRLRNAIALVNGELKHPIPQPKNI